MILIIKYRKVCTINMDKPTNESPNGEIYQIIRLGRLKCR